MTRTWVVSSGYGCIGNHGGRCYHVPKRDLFTFCGLDVRYVSTVDMTVAQCDSKHGDRINFAEDRSCLAGPIARRSSIRGQMAHLHSQRSVTQPYLVGFVLRTLLQCLFLVSALPRLHSMYTYDVGLFNQRYLGPPGVTWPECICHS